MPICPYAYMPICPYDQFHFDMVVKTPFRSRTFLYVYTWSPPKNVIFGLFELDTFYLCGQSARDLRSPRRIFRNIIFPAFWGHF